MQRFGSAPCSFAAILATSWGCRSLELTLKGSNHVHAPSRWQKLFAALLLAFLSAQVNAQEPTLNRLISSAKQEGKLVLSGPADPLLRKGLPEKFKDRFGIVVEYIGASSNDAIGRLRQERQAGLYTIDMMLVGPTALVGVYSEKMLDPLRPLLLEEVLDGRHWKGGKPRFSDPEAKYSLRLAERVTALFMINKTDRQARRVSLHS